MGRTLSEEEEAAAARRKMGMLRGLVSNADNADSPSGPARKKERLSSGLGRALQQITAGRGAGAGVDRARASRPGGAAGPAGQVLAWLGTGGGRGSPRRASRPRVQLGDPRRPEARSEEESPEEPPAKKICLRTQLRGSNVAAKLATKTKPAARSSPSAKRPKGLAKPSLRSKQQERSSPSSSHEAESPKVEKAPLRKVINALQVQKETELRPPSPCSERASEGSNSPERPSAASSSRSRSSSSQKLARSVTVEREATVADSPVQEPAASSGGFQQVVLDRLHLLCQDNEDASVLAEYIVAMVAGNKSREDIAKELEPFFNSMDTSTEFVEWVEGVKVKFLTGSLLQVGGPGTGSSPLKGAKVKSPLKQAAARSSSSTQAADAAAHVVVTKRAVLRPNPTFVADPPTAVPVSAALSPQTLASSPRQALTYKAAAAPSATTASAASPVKQDRKHLLENMTRQLQTILTKLNDQAINDETREKYQALAQSIQTQMAKVSGPAPRPVAPTRPRAGYYRRR